MSNVRAVLAVPLFTLIAAPAIAAPSAPAPPPPISESIYRFDVTITGLEDGPRPPVATYTLMLAEHRRGEIATGVNLPMSAPAGAAPVARESVGLKLDLEYSLQGGVPVVAGSIQASSAEPPTATTAAVLHRWSLDAYAPVPAGAPTLLGAGYDVASHRRYEVTITAQRVR